MATADARSYKIKLNTGTRAQRREGREKGNGGGEAWLHTTDWEALRTQSSTVRTGAAVGVGVGAGVGGGVGAGVGDGNDVIAGTAAEDEIAAARPRAA